MKNVLVINNGTAGLYGFRRELLEELCKNHNVIVLAKDTGNRNELVTMGCSFVPAEIEYHGINPLQEISLIWFYKRMIKEHKPDIVLTYTIKPNIYGGIACANLGIPYIANITGLGTAVENKGWMQKITVPLYRYGLRKAKKVFFQNRENLDFMLRRSIVSDNYELIPGSGVNLKRFKLMDYPHNDTVDFTFISRVMKEKGIDQYLEAARKIHPKYSNAIFHVYGKCDGKYESILNKMMDDGIIVYHGYTTDVIGVHSKSSCTIHPSYYPEGMSNVLLESAACGRPIITTDRAGCREAIENGVNGFIVRQQDSKDLIDKIEKFMSLSWEQRREMGIQGRRKVENEFDRDIVVRRYMEEINRAGL